MPYPFQNHNVNNKQSELEKVLRALTAEQIFKSLHHIAALANVSENENSTADETTAPQPSRKSRRGKTGNELRKNAAPEYQQFIRAKRRPQSLNEKANANRLRNTRSWKNAAKCRKQWLVKIKKEDEKNATWIRRETRRKQYWASRGDKCLHGKVCFSFATPRDVSAFFRTGAETTNEQA